MMHAGLAFLDPSIVTGVRDQLATTFGQKVTAVVPDVVDFVEFEAEAQRTPEQRRAFEQGARALHARRRLVGDAVATAFIAHFDARLNPNRRTDLSVRLKLDALSLVQEDQMDEDIAVNSCGNRLREQSEYEFFALSTRIASLVGKDRFDDQENPVLPHVFARALMAALTEVESTPSARLATFKAFSPVLLDILPAVLSDANAWLSSRGIDIEVDVPYGQPLVTPERPYLPGPAAPPDFSAAEAGIGLLAQLAHQARAAAPANNLADAAPAPPQHQLPPTDSHSPRALHNVRKELHGILSDEEALVADVVTVMFDQLFADRRIPQILKDIVARLQMPVLQLALVDRTVFSNPHHPARRLIDLVAEFGMTLELGDAHGSTIDSIARIVDEVARRHATDPAAFTVAYHRLDDMFYHHEESALEADPDIRELQEAEATECAQRAAKALVISRLRGRTLPVTVQAFIQIAWRNVLIRDYLDGGLNGKAWKLGVATLDELLKSVQLPASRADRQNLAKGLSSLIGLIRDGAEHADVHPHLVEEFFIDLQRLHELAVRGDLDDELCPPDLDFTAASTPESEALALTSPSARLTELGLACGDWIEIREGVSGKRWRLTWVTPNKGTCVFKHYETGTRRIVSLEELERQIRTGDASAIPYPGVTTTALAEAFRAVARVHNTDQARDIQGRQALPLRGKAPHIGTARRSN
jgi:hypothetical protein